LAGYHVAGVQTNVQFLARIATSASFVEARLDTALIAREHAHLLAPLEAPGDPVWELAAWQSLPLPGSNGSPWADRSGWRLGEYSERTVTLRWRDAERPVRLRFSSPPPAIPGVTTFRDADFVHVFQGARHDSFRVLDPYLPAADSGDHAGGLTAPMPGRIIALHVSAGDKVERGAALIVMEAMKMEHTVTAPAAGTVARILCAVGDQVKEGAELLVLET